MECLCKQLRGKGLEQANGEGWEVATIHLCVASSDDEACYVAESVGKISKTDV